MAARRPKMRAVSLQVMPLLDHDSHLRAFDYACEHVNNVRKSELQPVGLGQDACADDVDQGASMVGSKAELAC